MDELIPITNELQDISAKLGMTLLDLPQIVIIGSQSSGKSSVLENIVRRDFLPRGTGIVTRCPLILQLIHESGSSEDTRARFLHKGDIEYYDFKDIKNEIIRQTNVLAGSAKNISDKPITLKIYSPDFLTLTLIDLPGLTKVSLDSQPKDIEQQIRKICLKYARPENSIILAISQGNVDLANSDSLKFAEELDPEGKRTFSVITKLDIMDKGTDAYDILTGKVLPKELGYIGVVSRSQADINNNKPIEDSLRDEKLYFEEHYPDIAHKNGTSFLTQTLNMLLKRHISKCQPSLLNEVEEKINTASKRLKKLGPARAYKRVDIPMLLDNFNCEYSMISDGDFDENMEYIRGGALIYNILYEEFRNNIRKIDIRSNLTDEVLKATLQNTCGAEQMSFSRERAFKRLIREQIKKLKNPILKCIDGVFDAMKGFVNEAIENVGLAHFSKLRIRIENETHSLMESSLKTTQIWIREMILSEMTDAMSTTANYKSGYKLEKMNNRDLSVAEQYKATCDSQWTSTALQVASFGSMILFELFKMKYPQFQMIDVLSLAKMFKDVMNVFDNKNSSIEENKSNYGPILETTFKGFPNILERKDLIIHYMLNPDSEVYDSLMNPELNYQEEQSAEFNRTVNEEFECAVLKSFVIGYYNMVLENVCHNVPEFIQTYLVTHVRDNLQTHLQRIHLDPDMDNLLEDESIQAERRSTISLLKDLENMRNRIEELCSTI